MPPSSTSPGSPRDDHDDLVFLDEHPAPTTAGTAPHVWRVMIIDDDEDVHSTTTFALGNLDMQHRPLEFVHAYSVGTRRAKCSRPNPTSPSSCSTWSWNRTTLSLHLVRYIRETLKLADTRIILRTGQPGYCARNRRHPRFRHQRLQDQIRTDPHQAVYHGDGGDPLLRADSRHQRQRKAWTRWCKPVPN
ncbi:hypothetical protein LP420_00600 [Massilia sp. B-10]|nr:hypothetical protein LP420_00600 [Massilia sp. B-10]